MKHAVLICLLTVLAISVTFADADKDLLLHLSFEDTADAAFARGDGKAALKVRKDKQIVVLDKAEFAPGALGKGIVCDTRFVEYPGARNLNPHEGTLELWVKPLNWQSDDDLFHTFLVTSKNEKQQMILYRYFRTKTDKGISRSMTFYLLGDPAGEKRRALTTATYRDFTWKPGQWHHIAAVWKKWEMQLFIDGVLLVRKEGGALPSKAFQTLQIAPPWGGEGRRKSVIDEVKIYGRALSAKEIRTSYGRTLARIAQTQPDAVPCPGVQVQLMGFPAQKKLLVHVGAAALGITNSGKLTGEIKLTRKAINRDAVSGTLPGFTEALDTIMWLPTATLTPGAYDLSVSVSDPAGKELGAKTVEYIHPEQPEWAKQKWGESRAVLPPYDPVQVDPNAVTAKVWGREYDFGRSLLLSQVTQIPDENAAIADCVGRFHQEAELLAAPVQLRGKVNGQELRLDKAETKLEGNHPTYALFRSQAKNGLLFVKAGVLVEYDGIMQYYIVIHPQQALDIEDLRIEIPLKRKYVRLMNANSVDGYKQNCFAGGVSQRDGIVYKSGWKPLVWVGDEYRGFAYIGDTSRGWYGDLEADNRIQIINNGPVSKMVLRLIPDMKGRKEPIQIELAFAATPLRPLPKGWRGLVRDGVMTKPEPRPGDKDPIGEPVNFRVWWSHGPGMTMDHSYPVPKHPPEVLKKCWTFVPGLSDIQHHYPNSTWAKGPASRTYIGDWSSMSTAQIIDRLGGPPLTGGRVDWNTNIRDFWLYHLFQMMRCGLDGLYVDDPYIYPSYNDRTGKAWVDEDGKLRPCYGMFGLRDWFRRVRVLAYQFSDQPWIDLHMSGQLMLPFYSFCDSIVNGEHLNLRLNKFKNNKDKHYLDILPIDELKAQYMSTQWGVAAFLLPELGSSSKPGLETPTRELLAQFLPHDVMFWRGWCKKDEVDKALRALQHEFRVGEEDCRFLPYWEAGEIIKGQNEKLVCSAYLRTGKVMLVVGNWSDEKAAAQFTLDLATLGLNINKPIQAKDAVTQKAVKAEGSTITLDIPPRDYALVWVENR
ncbi:MAG: LamG domain-containing protein [Planctomycetes bacterium]|nr:LamG domain-containing protein [Planctomycetota bacterium]